jgi:peptidoglycan hydrolase-like protein with peptidoglycan-binding domain
MTILAAPRRAWHLGLSAAALVLGATIGSGLVVSTPSAEAASVFAQEPVQPHRMNRAGPDQEAQADAMPRQEEGAGATPGPQMQISAPLTHDDLVRVQERLKALGYDPGAADGRPNQRTIQALNTYRESLGLQPVETIDSQAVAPLRP